MFRIVLRVTGVDLDDDDQFDSLVTASEDFVWTTVDGRTLATLALDSTKPVDDTILAVRRLTARCPDVRFTEIDSDSVGISDIAHRVGVSREGVRLWSQGQRGPGGFPTPLGSISGSDRSAVRFWVWGDVNRWLDEHFGLGDGYSYLSFEERIELNACLNRVAHDYDKEWAEVDVRSNGFQLDVPSAHTAWHEAVVVGFIDGSSTWGKLERILPPSDKKVRSR